MKTIDVDLHSLLPKGQVETEMKDGRLCMTTTQRVSDRFDKEHLTVNHYVSVPGAYHLPLRIDLTVKIDAPGLCLLFGNGHLNFGTPWSDNRRLDDIIEPSHKTRFFHHYIPLNHFVEISLLYDLKAMQILVDGEERFYSGKERYMKSALLPEANEKGFPLRISCTKHTILEIKSIHITEYDETAGIEHEAASQPEPVSINNAVGKDQKPTFDACISMLPEDIKAEVVQMDNYLRSLKPMKFKRLLEKHGNKISYVASDFGFSYAVHPSNDVMTHSLGWYILTNSKPELWHRKANGMEAVLNKIAETSPGLAGRMFANLSECIGCSQGCAVRTPYEFDGKRKITCHGLLQLKMCASDFADALEFIRTTNEYYGAVEV